MKTPDKIYIPNKPVEISAAYSSRTAGNDVEYIRKDALLEWIKKEMGEWSSESNTVQGVKMGLILVIDKIESL